MCMSILHHFYNKPQLLQSFRRESQYCFVFFSPLGYIRDKPTTTFIKKLMDSVLGWQKDHKLFLIRHPSSILATSRRFKLKEGFIISPELPWRWQPIHTRKSRFVHQLTALIEQCLAPSTLQAVIQICPNLHHKATSQRHHILLARLTSLSKCQYAPSVTGGKVFFAAWVSLQVCTSIVIR